MINPAAFVKMKMRERESQRHKNRTGGYEKFVASEREALRKIFGAKSKIHKPSGNMAAALTFPAVFNMDETQGKFLYNCVRNLKPALVVEAGVANGVSTAHMLAAMEDNRKGTLISIELLRGKGAGALVPEELHNRWKILFGNSLKIIPALGREFKLHKKIADSQGGKAESVMIKRIADAQADESASVMIKRIPDAEGREAASVMIDAFLHDSEHTYRHMMGEYNAAWPLIRKGGLLISDDVNMNDAFLDFAEAAGRKVVCVRGKSHPSILGVIKK